jgi:hypothetical protein
MVGGLLAGTCVLAKTYAPAAGITRYGLLDAVRRCRMIVTPGRTRGL